MAMRKMHHPKGKGNLRRHAGKKSPRSAVVVPEKIAGKQPFAKHVKKLEPDDRPRPAVGAQHMQPQAKKAKARAALLRRLGSRGI
jgi:hypothetical protein